MISTVEDETKLLPVRVRVKLGAPAVTEVGDMLLSKGTGLTSSSESAFDVWFSDAGSLTVIVTSPVFVRSDAGIVPWIEVAET